MDSLFILIPIALVFVAVAVKAFMWAVDSRQYDDLDAAANSILFEDDANVKVAPGLLGQSAESTAHVDVDESVSAPADDDVECVSTNPGAKRQQMP